MENSTIAWAFITFWLFVVAIRLISARNRMVNEVTELRERVRMLEQARTHTHADPTASRGLGVLFVWLVLLLVAVVMIILYNLAPV